MMAGLGKRERLLVARRAGETVAWSIVKRYSPRWGYRFTCETSSYVRADLQHQGIGTQLKRLVLEICDALGYRHVVAKIVSTNLASIHYNIKLGYEVVGVQRQVGKLDGDWLDVCVLQYLFDRA